MTIKVLNNGFVRFVDKMGDDYSIIRSARVSTGTEEKVSKEKDRKLIHYLYNHKHFTPFEQVVFTFHIRSPLFVNQQILRHRTFSFNSESARFKEFVWDGYIPDELRIQDKKNKQNSYGSVDDVEWWQNEIKNSYEISKNTYEKMIDRGIAREQARTVMPMGQYTEMYFTVDLRNLLHFILLRSHKHAQKEIQEYSNAILNILHSFYDLQWTMEVFDKNMELEYNLFELIEEKSIDEVIKKLKGE